MMKAVIPLFILILVTGLVTAGCLNNAAEARDWTEKGEAEHVMGRYEEAVLAFDQAVTIDPGYGRAWRDRGLSLALLNRTTEAEESFQKALLIDPQDMEALYYQALSRSHAGNIPGALESSQRVIAIPPKNRDDAITLTQAWTLQGNILTKLGRIEEANQSYRQAHETMMSTI
jgi:tetratricopeptide (TPR) repeat protein